MRKAIFDSFTEGRWSPHTTDKNRDMKAITSFKIFAWYGKYDFLIQWFKSRIFSSDLSDSITADAVKLSNQSWLEIYESQPLTIKHLIISIIYIWSVMDEGEVSSKKKDRIRFENHVNRKKT